MSNRQIFISYAGQDGDWARSFAQALERHGLRIWLDQPQATPGDSVRDAVEARLRESDIFVALLESEHPVNPNVYFELGAAIGMGKRVVAVVPRELKVAEFPLDLLRSRSYLIRESPEATAEELAHTLAA